MPTQTCKTHFAAGPALVTEHGNHGGKDKTA